MAHTCHGTRRSYSIRVTPDLAWRVPRSGAKDRHEKFEQGQSKVRHGSADYYLIHRQAVSERVAVADLERGLVVEPEQFARRRTGRRSWPASERADLIGASRRPYP